MREMLRSNIKKTSLILLFIVSVCFFGGCAFYSELWKQRDNLKDAALNRPNLYGKTQQEIINSFGSPIETRTSYSSRGQTDYWTYKCLASKPFDARYRHYRIEITFTNGVADDVSYEEEAT